MPKLPFAGFPGSAHYQVHRDVLRLRYRFPWMDAFRTKASPYRASRNEKRTFFEWARRFLFSGGDTSEWLPTVALDALEQKRLDHSLSLGEAVRLHLEVCERGNKWLAPLSPETLRVATRPTLRRFVLRFGEHRALDTISGDEIANFVRGLGGRKETKQRRLCPISKLFTWAIREGFLPGPNPAHGIVFWRERGERPHDGYRKSYTQEEFERLLAAAQTDPLALDAIYFGRYLAARPQDAVALRWEDWHWDQLYVSVPRRKTRNRGVEVSRVDMHPVLAERFAHRQGQSGYCLQHAGQATKVPWPSDEELRRRVEETSRSAVARALGVSEAAVRKRLKSAGSRGADMSRLDLGKSISQRVARITKAAGLYEPGIQPYYVLRHTFACESLRAGFAPAVVAAEMGISFQTLQKHYWHAVPRGELDDRRTNRWGLERDALPRPA
ncbi:MAG: hypothetical protein D6731_00365 [Planctomycetota bacterium]|nr:MAG: hypothetical protein D6731_00365 [Planctomycetota bacterium]